MNEENVRLPEPEVTRSSDIPPERAPDDPTRINKPDERPARKGFLAPAMLGRDLDLNAV